MIVGLSSDCSSTISSTVTTFFLTTGASGGTSLEGTVGPSLPI